MGAILTVMGLFLLGMVLVAIEAFVLPGFGVIGFFGAGVLFWASLHAWTALDPIWGLLLAGSAMAFSLGIVVWMPKTRLGKRLTLKREISSTSGYDEDAKRAGLAIGEIGVSDTDLKPSGFARFGDSRVEVHSGGEWVEKGTRLEVVELRDGRVLVETVE